MKESSKRFTFGKQPCSTSVLLHRSQKLHTVRTLHCSLHQHDVAHAAACVQSFLLAKLLQATFNWKLHECQQRPDHLVLNRMQKTLSDGHLCLIRTFFFPSTRVQAVHSRAQFDKITNEVLLLQLNHTKTNRTHCGVVLRTVRWF